MDAPRSCLAGITTPTAVVLEAGVTSEDAIASPLTGARAALLAIDVVESDHPLGTIVLGDTLVLDTAGGAITVVVSRAKIVFFDRWIAAAPLTTTPPEIVALLRRATGAGTLAYREHALASKSRVRLRAIVEPSGPRSFIARSDLGPVVVEEIVSG